MASRRDQLQSYQFLVQRVVSAMVLHETDPVQSPLRRLTGAVFASVMVAVIALAAVGVYGLVKRGGNERWKNGDAIVVEKETGTRYVFRLEQGEEPGSKKRLLHPVSNFASAALIVGSTEVIQVSRNSLLDIPRGPRIGIRDAPDALPDPGRLKGAPWTLCSEPELNVAGETISQTLLAVGEAPSRGIRIPRNSNGAILVRDIDLGTLHLVWRSHRYPISRANERAVLFGLDLLQLNPPQVKVGTAWLSALPTGQALAPLAVPGRGGASSAAPGRQVGQILLHGRDDTGSYYLVLPERVREITRVQARTTLTATRSDAVKVSSSEAATLLDRAEDRPPPSDTDPPADPKLLEMADVRNPSSTLCASFFDGGSVPQISYQALVLGTELAVATERRDPAGNVFADRVKVQAGYGAIVVALASPDADPKRSPVFLVTDLGRRYPIADPEVQKILEYGNVEPTPMPFSLVERIPPGDALDPDLANRPVSAS
ncbi:MAG TPA: type VII secretion protein EccB [Cryptosporangiaceae bacterium]|nr:type VII secretion protein EccB [Cryptosporangiaceae bacterium]